MKLIASAVLACLLALAALSPAHAHRLRVFATVEQGVITGYAYFVGGARATGASVVFRDSGGRELHRATADSRGGFSWKPAKPQTIRISVDAGEGHVGTIVIDGARLAGDRAEGAVETESEQSAAELLSPAQRETIEAAIDAAVARHTRPLMEKFEAMETRTRFNDIVGGIGMIIGVAGAAMWAMSRRKGGAA
jgi:nickel transport protein